MLAKIAHRDPRTWDLYLPYALFAYRTFPHHSTNMTPFRLLYGREAVLPTDEILLPPKEREEVFLNTYVSEVTDRMAAMWELARQNITQAQTRQRKTHNRKAKRAKFQVGDRVLLYSPKDKSGPLRKLALPNKGPFVITKVTDTNTFIVPQDHPRAKEKCVAWDRIHSCPELNQPLTESTEDQPTNRSLN